MLITKHMSFYLHVSRVSQGYLFGAHANPANLVKGLYESIKDMAEDKKCLYDKIKAVF